MTTTVFAGDSGPGRLELDDAELRVVSGPDKGLVVSLGTDSMVVGTSADCDIVLHDEMVSRRHAEIMATLQGYVIRDLGSKNGVVIGSVLVERAPLLHGMRIRVGKSVLALKARRGRRSIPLVQAGWFSSLVAHSVKMRAVVATLQELASSDLCVLILGETGTGKEIAAQALHAASPRATGPFVVFDCGTASPAIAASDLFGHEKGAFPGADEERAGLFDEAQGGTLFLDEVSALPLEVQSPLLRAIDRGLIRSVGSPTERRHDVRVVASSHRNLAEEVRRGTFREDLYYRLSVAAVRVPPLRERPDDIPILAKMFASEFGVSLPDELRTLLASYDWPGNVRELRNTILRLSVQPQGIAPIPPRGSVRAPALAPAPAPDPSAPPAAAPARTPEASPEASAAPPGGAAPPAVEEPWAPLHEARRQALEEFERRYVERALQRAHGVVAVAAKAAGVSRQVFVRMAARHGIPLPPGGAGSRD